MKLTKDDILDMDCPAGSNLKGIELSRLREVVKELLDYEVMLWNGMSEEYDIPKLLFRDGQYDKLKEMFGEVLE